MGHSVCPWLVGYLLACPLRRWLHDPASLLRPHVREGMTVLEPGPGMGYFTIELARLVGPSGRVIAVDIQPKMIAALKRRAAKAGLAERLDARVATPDSLCLADLSGRVDFTLAFAMVHEMPSSASFFAEAAMASRPGATMLLAEPAGHVGDNAFTQELNDAAGAGFSVVDRLTIRRSHAALLRTCVTQQARG